MEEGVVVRWLKAEGDAIGKDELLFELETDKAVMEVPSPASGILLQIILPQGPVKPEQIVGWVGNRGEEVQDVLHRPPATSNKVEEITQKRQPSQPSRGAATPAARRRAKELGVDLGTLIGSGPGGRIVEQNVEDAAASRIQSPGTGVSQRQMDRQVLIRRLAGTWQTVPHIYVSRELDARGIVDARKGPATRSGPHISLTDVILYVISRTLPDFSELAMTWRGEVLKAAKEINTSLAIDTDRGVVAPVIHNIGALTVEEISARRRELTDLALKHQLGPNQVSGGNFTLTNLGVEGVDFFAPMINSPQTAILAVGRAAQKPVVARGALGVGWRMWATLAVDHRSADGMSAARFLTALQHKINQLPEEFGKLS